MDNLSEIAERAYALAQRKEAALIMSRHGPIVVSTNTRDYRRSKPDQLIGVYNSSISYKWILEDLRSIENGTRNK